MVELATFRMFHRAAPARQPEPPPEAPSAPVALAPVAPEPLPVEASLPVEAPLSAEAPLPAEASSPFEAPLPVEAPSHVDEPAPTQFTQELRARRRAARTDMRQSGAWAEPETPPPGPSLAESVAFVSEAPAHIAPAEPEPVAAEHHHAEPAVETAPVEEFAPAEEAAGPSAHSPEHHPIEEPETVHAALPEFVEEPVAPPPEAELAEEPYPVHVDPYPEPEVFAEAHESAAESVAAYEDVPAAALEEPHPHAVFEPEPVEPAPEAEAEPALDPVVAHPSTPTPISDYLHTIHDMPPSAPHVDEPVANLEDPAPLYTESPVEEPWPIEPPSILLNQHALPIEPPAPLASEIETEPTSAEAWVTPEEYHADSLELDYRLLGLANPKVCTVIGKLGDATPTPMSVGGAGIYRPDGFRPAPWSGFAYDISPDGRTGLVLGTRILTARGEIPVEELIPGDTALALRGPALLPIVWIGRSVASPSPVEIDAGAFGPGRPGRSLRVGADHPIFMETMPVAARDLVNGETIRSVESEAEELFHIDVGYAEVLMAEGIPLASGSR